MSYFGYHRVSTKEQHLDRGINEIQSYCAANNLELKKIYMDKISGNNFDRPRYVVMKEDVLRSGDELIITEMDRLGRTKKDILKELEYFRDNNIRVRILEIPTTLMDLSDMDSTIAKLVLETINNMLLEMFASLAQAEQEKRKKRQAEGIAAKKARGDWDNYGRPCKLDQNVFNEAYALVEKGIEKPTDVMRKLNLNKATYYNYRKKYLAKYKKNN